VRWEVRCGLRCSEVAGEDGVGVGSGEEMGVAAGDEVVGGGRQERRTQVFLDAERREGGEVGALVAEDREVERRRLRHYIELPSATYKAW
jgi:hypothetical protein